MKEIDEIKEAKKASKVYIYNIIEYIFYGFCVLAGSAGLFLYANKEKIQWHLDTIWAWILILIMFVYAITATGIKIRTDYKYRKNIFVSYCNKDKELMQSFQNAFKEIPYNKKKRYDFKLLYDEDVLKLGDNITDKITDSIEKSSACIAIVTKDYLESDWPLKELEIIMKKGRKSIPVIINKGNSGVINKLPEILSDIKCLELKSEDKTEIENAVNNIIAAIVA